MADETFLQMYERHRRKEQLDWYRDRYREFETADRHAVDVSAGLMLLTTVVASLAAAGFAREVGLERIWALMGIVLPAVATAFAAYRTLFAFQQQAKVYRDAVLSLQITRALAPDFTPDGSRVEGTLDPEKYVLEVEQVFQREQSQWGQIAAEIRPILTRVANAPDDPAATGVNGAGGGGGAAAGGNAGGDGGDDAAGNANPDVDGAHEEAADNAGEGAVVSEGDGAASGDAADNAGEGAVVNADQVAAGDVGSELAGVANGGTGDRLADGVAGTAGDGAPGAAGQGPADNAAQDEAPPSAAGDPLSTMTFTTAPSETGLVPEESVATETGEEPPLAPLQEPGPSPEETPAASAEEPADGPPPEEERG